MSLLRVDASLLVLVRRAYTFTLIGQMNRVTPRINRIDLEIFARLAISPSLFPDVVVQCCKRKGKKLLRVLPVCIIFASVYAPAGTQSE